jgi:hypothetical protein
MRYLLALCLPLLCLVLLVVLWCYPKTQQFNLADPLSDVRYYRGFGLTDERGLFGKYYYRIDTVLTLPEDGVCTIDYTDGSETHPFFACYPDGRIRAKGHCKVTLDNLRQPISMQNIIDGVFLSPDGSITSQIEDGTGVETYWTFDGIKIWEASKVMSQATRVTMWHRNGQLYVVEHYKHGKKDGNFRFYAPDGALNRTEVFEDGKEVKP